MRFPENIKLESCFELAQPGSLGMCLYTYCVEEIKTYFEIICASNARNNTDIIKNEFGELSFSFVAPDGYFWTLIARNSA
jgi:uncharacterized glyoxalase superfamily protein PhnB